jgi:branched-chain amino acid aminotransferase
MALPAEQLLREAADAVCRSIVDVELARLRITVTAGPGPAGSVRGAGPPTLLVTATPTQRPAAPETTLVVPWRRNHRGALTGVKSTSYAENVVALAAARRAGVGEALLANVADELCEGTGTNVFCVLDGVAVTPPLSSGCLAGVTRALVLEWCPEVVERGLGLAELGRAEEVFLTSSTRDVHAVAAVDGNRPGGPAAAVPGPVTAKIAAAFATAAAQEADPL